MDSERSDEINLKKKNRNFKQNQFILYLFFNNLNIVQEYNINQLEPNEPMDVDVWENYNNVRPNSYVMIPSVHHTEKIIKDNLGYLYFKSKSTERKM